MATVGCSQATLGTSCATLEDGLKHVDASAEEALLLQQLADRY